MAEITPTNLRQDKAMGTGGMCKTEDENRNEVVEELRKTFSQTGRLNPAAIDEVLLHEELKWMDKPREFNGMPTRSFVRCGGYKGATTISAAVTSGASAGDMKWDLENGYMALHPPSEHLVLEPLTGDGGEAKYGAWLLSAGRCFEDLVVDPCSAQGGRDGKV
jgi:hypothetical protein